MKKLLGCLTVLPLSIALVVACGSSSSSDNAAGDGGSSGSSGTSGASGTSGTSGTSGASGTSGTSGASGTSGDAASDAPTGERACHPAKTDCKPGEVCTDIGRTSPVCRASCKSDGDCGAGFGCVITTPGSPETGACIPTCAPFGTDCAGGFTCSRVPEQAGGVTQTSHAAFCKPIGATALMAACVNDPGSCGANADCVFFPEAPQNESLADSKCHTLCDATHPCGAGKGSCFTKAGDAFGFCNGG
jgi:hypothetical protein